ncbi:MAG: tetratricopeptide repeat protein [Ignavibacteriaceae bacterium]|nr:tetratricopeptide repeat protein [Ignavibacteriaceae bacterium]
MAKSAAEIFNDKVNLIYEYNDKSPLFVRMANTEIENNNIDQAIYILEEGTKIYPQYAAAYLILGKAYILLGNYSNAFKYIKKGSDLIHSKKTYEYYLKELENVKKQRSLFSGSSRNVFLPHDEISSKPGNSGFYDEEELKSKGKEPSKSFDDSLEQIAKEISTARMPELRDSEISSGVQAENESGSSMIVSETLAKIYIAQGELIEAIEVYKKLLRKDPQKEEYYNQKINGLKSELEF